MQHIDEDLPMAFSGVYAEAAELLMGLHKRVPVEGT